MLRSNHSCLLLSLAFFASVVLGCASLPRPTPADLTRARTRFPGASLASLEAGRRAFADNCSSCHALPRPESKSPEQWAKVIDEMSGEAKLSARTKELLAQFVLTMSDRSSASSDQRKVDPYSRESSGASIANNSRTRRGD